MTSQSNHPGPRGLRRTVAPTFRAIDLVQLKQQSRIDGDDEDMLLIEYIEAATDFVERDQGRALLQSTWQAVYDEWPDCGVFYLPNPPLISVSSITYLDESGASQTLSSSVYSVDAVSQPGRVSLAYGQSWPVILSQQAAITVTFLAGYSSAANVPQRTKQAIRILAGHWFKCREPVVIGASVANVPLSVTELLEPDRILSYR